MSVAIFDGSSERRDQKSGVFALDEVGDLIGVPDAGEAMMRLRAKFAQRVQAEVRAACLRAIGASEDGSGSVFAADVEPGDDGLDGDGSTALDEADDEDGAASIAMSSSRTRRRSVTAPHRIERRPIVVGFARGGGP